MPDIDAPSVTHRILSSPKAGSAPDEYEDAAAVYDEAWPLRAAVADGATESAFAGLWADLLVTQSTQADVRDASALRARLPDWQSQWKAEVDERVENLPWYSQAKAADGAFATLLVLSLQPDHSWTAVAVGDCVMMHLRDEELLEAWPIADPDAFTNRPALLSSRPTDDLPTPQVHTGTWEPGDTFLLATDATAAWLLRSDPAAARLMDPDRFQLQVAAARSNGGLHNDDATLAVLETEEDEA